VVPAGRGRNGLPAGPTKPPDSRDASDPALRALDDPCAGSLLDYRANTSVARGGKRGPRASEARPHEHRGEAPQGAPARVMGRRSLPVKGPAQPQGGHGCGVPRQRFAALRSPRIVSRRARTEDGWAPPIPATMTLAPGSVRLNRCLKSESVFCRRRRGLRARLRVFRCSYRRPARASTARQRCNAPQECGIATRPRPRDQTIVAVSRYGCRPRWATLRDLRVRVLSLLVASIAHLSFTDCSRGSRTLWRGRWARVARSCIAVLYFSN
jgi:hypothetical protein